MPEYLAPGVYVEEVSFRSKSIEGVPTSTTGYAGITRYGPVQYFNGPKTSEPRLITSFTEFERVYGGLEEVQISGGRIAYLAQAARAFFENGGKRLYVSRVFVARATDANLGVASRAIINGGLTATWRARWPGEMGNVLVETRPVRSRVTISNATGSIKVQRVKNGAVIEVLDAPKPLDRGGRWCVQIGAFSDSDEAARLKSKLIRKYKTAKVIQFAGPTGDWVRIRPLDDDRSRAFEVARDTKVNEGGVFLVRLD